jgi:hypothetical protein
VILGAGVVGARLVVCVNVTAQLLVILLDHPLDVVGMPEHAQLAHRVLHRIECDGVHGAGRLDVLAVASTRDHFLGGALAAEPAGGRNQQDRDSHTDDLIPRAY